MVAAATQLWDSRRWNTLVACHSPLVARREIRFEIEASFWPAPPPGSHRLAVGRGVVDTRFEADALDERGVPGGLRGALLLRGAGEGAGRAVVPGSARGVPRAVVL